MTASGSALKEGLQCPHTALCPGRTILYMRQRRKRQEVPGVRPLPAALRHWTTLPRAQIMVSTDTLREERQHRKQTARGEKGGSPLTSRCVLAPAADGCIGKTEQGQRKGKRARSFP